MKTTANALFLSLAEEVKTVEIQGNSLEKGHPDIVAKRVGGVYQGDSVAFDITVLSDRVGFRPPLA